MGCFNPSPRADFQLPPVEPLMPPVRLVVLGEGAARVPIIDEPFWIGRDPGCDLCLWDLRISRKHASIGQMRGEYVLTSEGRHGVFVNGAKVPMLALRHGDRIDLTPPDAPNPVSMRFENLLEGTFVPESASLSAVWLAHQRANQASRAIPDFDVEGAIDSARLDVLRGRLKGVDSTAIVRLFPAVPDGAATDSWLRLLTALAGATHPALTRVLDGGLLPADGGARRWLAVEAVSGRSAALRIAEGPQALVTVCRRARALARHRPHPGRVTALRRAGHHRGPLPKRRKLGRPTRRSRPAPPSGSARHG